MSNVDLRQPYHFPLTRRRFLQTVGASLLLSGCGSATSREGVVATPTAVPNADSIADAYLAAWSAGDYARMFDLLSKDSRIRVREASRLARLYQQAMTEATTQTVESQLQSLLYNGYQATVGFRVIWQTALFDSITLDNQMRLLFTVDEGWRVVWQPTLILPQLGEGVSLAFLSEASVRGTIYDRQQQPIATIGELITVGVVPEQLHNQAATLHQLATITEEPLEAIQEKIYKAQPNWFVPIDTIDFETSLQYDDLLNAIPGVQRRVQQQRRYLHASTASHVVGYMGPIPDEARPDYRQAGYTGSELVGLMGVERWAEPYLAGKRGGRLAALSPSRQVIAEVANTPPQPGQDVHLTIDTVFQATVETLLGERIGSVIVMHPETGEIYALANYPRFTPAVITPGFDVNEWLARYTDETRPLVSRATQGVYPPASIFKIVTMAAALESLGMSPNATFTCPGIWTGLGDEFAKKCWLETGHGAINLFDGLTQSCDVVFYEIGLALHRQDPDLLPTWARHFGLGQPTNIELGENWGVVPDNVWKTTVLGQPFFEGDAVNSAIGQGYVLSTPLQIARLTAAVANGGRLIQPRIVQRIVGAAGSSQPSEPPPAPTVPLSAENLTLIRQSMAQVTSGAQGTARRAFAGFFESVAGKTGTAETGIAAPHSSFAGYSPIDAPRVVISVLLENAGEGSAEAAPLFRQVAEAFFAWEQAQPS